MINQTSKTPFAKFFIKILLALCLTCNSLYGTFSFAQSPNIAPQGVSAESSKSPLDQVAQDLASSPADLAHLYKWLKGAEAIEKGTLPDNKFEDFLHLRDQRVAILPSRRSSEFTFLPITESENGPQLIHKKNHLVFVPTINENGDLEVDGVFGALNSTGEGGRVVAKHQFPLESKILAVSPPDNFSTIVALCEDGSIYLIEKSALEKNAFDGWVPISKVFQISAESSETIKIFEKLKEEAQKTSNGNMKISIAHLTPGTQTDLLKTSRFTLLEQESDFKMRTGDVYIYFERKNDQNEVVESGKVALLPEASLYYNALEDFKYLAFLNMLLDPKGALMDPELQKALAPAKDKFEQMADLLKSTDLSPLASVLTFHSAEQRTSLLKSINELGNSLNSSTAGDGYNLEKLAETNRILDHVLTDDQNIQHPNNFERRQKHWQDLAKISGGKNAVPNPYEHPTSSQFQTLISKLMPTTAGMKKIGILFVSTYLAFPYFMDYYGGQEIPVLNWVFANLYPPALKNSAMRGPNTAAALITFSFIFIVPGISSLIGNVIRRTEKAVNENSPLARAAAKTEKMLKMAPASIAQGVRSFSRDWGHVTNWQLAIGACMRLAGLITYPVLRLVGNIGIKSTEVLFRQHSLNHSFELGLNPFSLITDPTTGKQRPAGFNNPFLELSGSTARIDDREKLRGLQAKTMRGKQAQEDLAFRLALLYVSSKSGSKDGINIDPGTIMQSVGLLQSKSQSSDQSYFDNQIQLILNPSPEKKHELALLQQEIINATAQLKIEDVQGLDREDFKNYIDLANEAVKKLKTSKYIEVKSRLRLNWLNFQLFMKEKFLAVVNLGYTSSIPLLKSKPADIGPSPIATTVNGFSTDFPILAVLGAYGKDFGDPNTPKEQWFGSSSFPYLGFNGAYTVITQLLAYFVKAAPLNYLNAGLSSEAKENPYLPIEHFLWSHNGRTESSLQSFAQEFVAVNTYTQSDFGGFYLRRFQKFWNFYQYLILTDVLANYFIFSGRTDGWTGWSAFASVFIGNLTFFMTYRHIWQFIQTGEEENSKRFSRNSKFNQELIVDLGKIIHQAEIEPSNTENVTQLRNIMQKALDTYEGNYPKIFKTVLTGTSSSSSERLTDSPESRHLLGLVHNINEQNHRIQALEKDLQLDNVGDEVTQTKQSELNEAIHQLEFSRSQLKELLENKISQLSEYDRDQLLQNAHGLFNLLRLTPPLATRSPKYFQFLLNLSLGGIGTTLIGYAFQNLTTSESFNNPETMMTLTLASLGVLSGIWLTTSKTAWDFYLSRWSQLKSRAGKTARTISLYGTLKTKEPTWNPEIKDPEPLSISRINSCQLIFSR